MKIAIIGCGYIGKALAKLWSLSQENSLVVTTRSAEKARELSQIAHDVCIIPEIDETHLIHLLEKQDVILLTIAADHPDAYEKTYLGTARALVKALSRPHSIKQIIYTSSTSIYGEHQGDWVTETTAPQPLNAQSHILLKTEETLWTLARQSLKVCLLRLGEIYGPGREISKRLKRLSGKSLPGTGENYSNLIHLDHLVPTIDKAMKSKLHGVFNLCEDEHPTRRELYEKICERENLMMPPWDHRASIHGGNKRVSNDKIKQALQITLSAKF